MNVCSYCDEQNEIVKSFSSEKCNAICGDCMDRVELVAPNAMMESLGGPDPYIRGVFAAASQFSRGKSITAIPQSDTSTGRSEKDFISRFTSLMQVGSDDWMPVNVHGTPVGRRTLLRYGVRPMPDLGRYDGVHRVCLACATGQLVPVYVPPPEYESVRERQYQTLVLPGAILPGERDCDRWQLFPKDEIADKSILELGCNSAMNGILNCVLSDDATHIGYDQDAEAIEDGNAVAELWDVSDRVELHACDATTVETFPAADVLFFLSVSNVINNDTFFRALKQSGAKTIFLETHNQHDDPNSWSIMHRRDGCMYQCIEWTELGRTSIVQGGPMIRSLFMGKMPT